MGKEQRKDNSSSVVEYTEELDLAMQGKVSMLEASGRFCGDRA